MNFSAVLDPLSLEALDRFESPDLLPGAVQAGMSYAGRMVLAQMKQLMDARFKNPSGQLAGSLQVVQDSPYEIAVGSDEPYAWRAIEYGFSRMTDSLGRYFPEWPMGEFSEGYHIGRDALELSAGEVGERLATTIDAYFARVFGGGQR